MMQRSTRRKNTEETVWETMRESTYKRHIHDRIVRQPSPAIDKLAHTLGLRRSRASDTKRAKTIRR